MADDKYTLTDKEVAQILNIKPVSLRSLRSQGRGLPYCRIGGRSIRYALDDVMALKAHRERREIIDPVTDMAGK